MGMENVLMIIIIELLNQNKMKAKLKKFKTNYDLFVVIEDNQIKTFASTDNTFVYKLSKQNCDEIFGVVDVDKMAEFSENSATSNGLNTFEYPYFKKGFNDGFNKAMGLNKDKVFTKEDMFNLYAHIVKNGIISGVEANEYIKSLQTPTEIEVEIEMKCPQCQEWGYVSECRKDCNKKFLQPKLDSEGQLILKKK